MKRQVIIWSLAALVLAVGIWLVVWARQTSKEVDAVESPREAPETVRKADAKSNQPKRVKSEEMSAKRDKPKANGKAKRRLSVMKWMELMTADLSPEARKLYDELQTASDNEKLSDAIRLAEIAQTNDTPAVRMKAIEVLRWFGEAALSNLPLFLVDEDEDVRAAAMDAVDGGLSDIEDETRRSELIERFLLIRGACTDDGVKMLSGQLNELSDERQSVATAVRILESSSDPLVIAEMKEVYHFQTGEDYVSPEAAEAWLQENYTPPEE